MKVNCILGSAIWPVLLYLNNYCIRNIMPQNLLSNLWKNKALNCHCGHVNAVWSPLQASWSLCLGAHQHVVLSCCLFWVFNPFPMTLLKHWSGCKEQSWSAWFLWGAKSGGCLMFNDGPVLGMTYSVTLEPLIALETASKSIPSACFTQSCCTARQRSVLTCPSHGQDPLKPLLAASNRLHTGLFRGTAILAIREYSASGMELKSPPDRHAAVFSDSKTINYINTWLESHHDRRCCIFKCAWI